ncbi:NADH:flavin oxidoreductase [Parahaliea mediterranea]|uniref:oxidoreductase n=1 Tax=Parahaliea mediterranea TaxID=651086 RepID=UPI000E2F596D|nr:NADH:flavin oxidoreductase [Parahaliea mediterranea]
MNGVQKQRLLTQPIRIGGVEIAGRFVKAAYTETMCTEDGFVTDQLIQHYEELARGGTPLLITGATYFNKYSQAMKRGLALDHDDKIPGLQRLTRTVQQYGSKIFVQLYHVGRQAAPGNVGRTDAQAPSARYEFTVGCMPRAMTIEEIHDCVYQFGLAAARAKQAGFDGIELHAAHGYLISSFLTPHTNRRTDQYGGSFENRLRFLVEVYRAMREQVGRDFPIVIKLNGHDDLPLRKGLNTEDCVRIALRMQKEGIDGVEVSCGHYESGITSDRGNWKGFFRTMVTYGAAKDWPASHRAVIRLLSPLLSWFYNRISGFRPAFNLSYAQAFKQALDIPVICVGGFAEVALIDEALESGGCDLVAAARPVIADPHLFNHLKAGVRGPQCDFCQGCFARAGAMPADCYNPRVRAEKALMLRAEQGTDLVSRPVNAGWQSCANEIRPTKTSPRNNDERQYEG